MSKSEFQHHLTQAGGEQGEVGERQFGFRAQHGAALGFERAIQHEVVGIAEILDLEPVGVADPALRRVMRAKSLG